MEITRKLDALFEEWGLSYGGNFQRDGIVDEAAYKGAPWEILFVSKEPNDTSEDLRLQARDAAAKLARRGTHAYWRNLPRLI